jgi:hypothetical protein
MEGKGFPARTDRWTAIEVEEFRVCELFLCGLFDQGQQIRGRCRFGD